MSLLSHPNIVRLFAVSISPLAIIMEYVQNGDLFHYLHAPERVNEPMNPVLQYLIALDVANGLAYLHSLKPPIIHRDMRYNVVICTSKKLVVHLMFLLYLLILILLLSTQR